MTQKQTLAPCSSCVRETTHKVLHERSVHEEDRITTYAMLECAGCRTISLGELVRFIPNGEVERSYYPSPIKRNRPNWVFSLAIGLVGKTDEEAIGGLLHEVYSAVAAGQYRLAAMGIRAALEQAMIARVGDLPSFDKKLNAFQEGGYISAIQRDALRATIDVGDAAMHRGFRPTEKELNTALDIVEGVFAAMYGHKDAADTLADRVPPRKMPNSL
jgi:Domain of unknown function (DUF4145)